MKISNKFQGKIHTNFRETCPSNIFQSDIQDVSEISKNCRKASNRFQRCPKHFRETSNRFRETSSRFQGDIQNISERRPKNFRVPSNHSEGEIYIYILGRHLMHFRVTSNHSEGEIYIYIYFRKTSNTFQGDIQQSSERYTHSPFPLLFLLFQLLPLVKKVVVTS